MKALPALLLALAAPFAGAAVVLTALPPEAASPSGTAAVQLVALNTGAEPVVFDCPARLAGTVHGATRAQPVEWTCLVAPPPTIEPGRFVVATFQCALPEDLRPPVRFEITPPGGPAIQLAAASPAPTPPPAPTEPDAPRKARRALVPGKADTALHRLFAERFNPHAPVYLIYGADDPVAKLQFSLKYRLLGFDECEGRPPLRTLQFGYTQRSLWDIKGRSSPFYDTSYMPEVFYEALAAPIANPDGRYHGLGLQTGFLHESNGRDGLASRSLNQMFVRSYFLLGSIERWHAIFVPELWLYVGPMDDNPRLKDYRGYGRLSVAFGYGDGASLTLATHCGKHFDHPTLQLDLAMPLSIAVLDFKTFLLVQYFNGYGESLVDYDRHSQTIRAGMALIR